jgi:hypothetical protein
MSKNKFYGDLEIKNVEEQDKRFILHFVEDKSSISLTQKMYEVSLTDEVSNASTLQRTQLQNVAKDLLAVLLLWDVKIEEVNQLIDLTIYSLNQTQKQAVDKLYGIPAEERRMSHIDSVLIGKSNAEEGTH